MPSSALAPLTPAEPTDTPSPSRHVPLWLLVLVTLAGTMAIHMFVPALPDAARALGSSASEMQLTITVYVIGLGLGQLIYGPLSDSLGRRPMLMVGLGLYTCAGLLAFLAPNAGVLIGARLGNGCTSGHGICGLGSLQLPSLWAVLTFMATGFVTANAVLLVGGH